MEREIAVVFREEAGKATATLTRSFGDFGLAEEAVQEAFIAAMDRWPTDGIPDSPGAWVTTTARRKALDRLRREQTFARKAHLVAFDQVVSGEDVGDLEAGDDRLALLFMCCHPSLAPDTQIALTLRAVGGLTTREIARAFMVLETTMAQRLTRAKRKIERAGIPFRVPPPELVEERLHQVLHIVYLIFNEGYAVTEGGELIREDLCAEAISLGELLVQLMPEEAEARGLLALMLLHDARRPARVGADGELITLEKQDRKRWDRDQIETGAGHVRRALEAGEVGPYQIQASIALAHTTAASAAETDWVHISWLYEQLGRVQPTPVVELNRAVALAMAEGPDRGLEMIERLGEDGRLNRYHLFHSARAELLRRAGRSVDAASAYRTAIDLTENERERAFLQQRLEEVTSLANN